MRKFKIGDNVYATDGVCLYEHKIVDTYIMNNRLIYKTNAGYDFDDRAVGNSVFKTLKQANKKRLTM